MRTLGGFICINFFVLCTMCVTIIIPFQVMLTLSLSSAKLAIYTKNSSRLMKSCCISLEMPYRTYGILAWQYLLRWLLQSRKTIPSELRMILTSYPEMLPSNTYSNGIRYIPSVNALIHGVLIDLQIIKQKINRNSRYLLKFIRYNQDTEIYPIQSRCLFMEGHIACLWRDILLVIDWPLFMFELCKFSIILTLQVQHNIKMLDKLNYIERARQNRRRSSRSPISIRNKIKELEFQLEKNHKLKESHKHIQNVQFNFLAHSTSIPAHLSHHYHNNLRNKFNFKSEQRKEAATNKNEQASLAVNQTPNRQIYSLKKNDEHSRRLNSPQSLTRKHSNESAGRFQQKQRDEKLKIYNNLMKENQRDEKSKIYNNLMKENHRYKEIYSRSVEKMHNLEQRLFNMKEEHNNQKLELQSMIEQLKNKIEQKKTNNLAHIYSYDAQNNNFLVVKDKIITQTDNQNSSSHLEPQKQILVTPVPSLLSGEQK